MVALFSIPAFFIVLREVLEACLVVGIALAHLNKTGNTQFRRMVWFGAAAGIVVSLIFGIVFAVIFFVNGEQIFKDKAEKIFEGFAFLVAAALLTWMIIWMLHLGKELREKMEQQIDNIVEDDEKTTRRRKLGLFLLIFVQVLREGIETFIFLFGSAAASEQGGWSAIPIPGVLAIIVGLAASFLVFKGMVNLDIQTFFNFSSVILIAFAAGLVSHAFHEIQEVDWFGPWKPDAPQKKDWYNATLWSTKDCCHDKTNEFWAMMRALFGYQDTPTFVEWSTYFAYWAIVIVVYITINWDYVRSSRNMIATRAQGYTALGFMFSFIGFVYSMLNRTWIGIVSMSLSLVLSVVTIVFVFAPLTRLVKMNTLRRQGMFGCGVAWVGMWFFIFVLHMVQLQCEGGEECSLGMFFFFGIIFNPKFLALGRMSGPSSVDPSSTKEWWPSLAVLSISVVIAFFFYAFLAFYVLIASRNVDAEGEDIGDDDVLLTEDPSVEVKAV